MKRLMLVVCTSVLLIGTWLAAPGRGVAGGVVGNGTSASCTEAALDGALAGGGLVTFACGSSPITLTVSAQKVIATDTTVDGGGLVALGGGGVTRVFVVNGGAALTLRRITIRNGNTAGEGGGVLNNGTLVVEGATFAYNNAGTHGGAIRNGGALHVSDSIFTVNGAGINGGAIDTTVSATLTRTLFTTNTAGYRGGGINNFTGLLTIVEGRFAGNTGNAYGGGIANDGSTASLNVMGSTFSGNSGGDVGGGLRNSGGAVVGDSTFSGNQATNRGGAIENSGSLSLINSTLSGNGAGNTGSGGVENTGTASVLFSTLVSNTSTSAFGGNVNTGAGLDIKASVVAYGGALNCTGPVSSLGYNLENGAFCNFTATGDSQNTDPSLGALADNGGPTLTHAPLAASAALEHVPFAQCIPVDQRGLKRPQGAACDAGAVEAAARDPVVSTANSMPWSMNGHETQRTGRGSIPGPDDPKRLGAPWPYLAGNRVGTSVAIDYAGTAYFGSDDTNLHAVDRLGVPRFAFHAGSAVRSGPAVVPVGFAPTPGETYVPPPTSTIYFGADDGKVYAVDSTGMPKWSLAPGGNASPVRSSPAALKRPAMSLNRVYVGAQNGKLYAIFETTPNSATLQWEITTGAPLTNSAALARDGSIVYAGGADGTLYCQDALTGTALPGTPAALGIGALTAAAVDKDGNVYVGGANGIVRSFTRFCEARPYFHPNLGGPIRAAPALAPNGDVLVIAGNTLYGVSNLGNVIWSQPFAVGVGHLSPIVDSVGTAYVAAENGNLYAVLRKRGTNQGVIKWSINVASGNNYLGPPALDGFGRVYLGAGDNRLEVVDDEPAFQIAFHSDISATANLDIYSLRETYGVLDPGRTQRLTEHAGAERQPAYSLDRSETGYISNRDFANDAFVADAAGGNEDNLTKPRPAAPFTPTSNELEPAFTPLDDLTGVSRLPDGKRYQALSSNASGVPHLYFTDLGAYELGNTRVLSLTAWATAQGVPNSITALLEPPTSTQSAIAFSPDGKRAAWRNCDLGGTTGQIRLLTLNGITSTLAAVSGFVFDPETRAACGDSPAFAPDSRWLAFREDKVLTIADTRGILPAVHSVGPLNGAPAHPNWSPDGSEIAVGLVTPTNSVDLFVLSGPEYKLPSPLTNSDTSDEPYYHYYKMPPPQAQALRPDRQFPGQTIEILGRGFDILNPQNNRVYFTDTLHATWLPAQVLGASVDPYEGLGVLTVKVPDLAGSGNVKVETRFGVYTCCQFHVLPVPLSVLQPRSVPGARVRVFGLGFDVTPATQNTVLFGGPSGWITATVISGTVGNLPGGTPPDQEYLVVEVPQGITETAAIRVRTAFGGSDCPCTFERLHPSMTIKRTSGLPHYATEGCDNVEVVLTGTDFPNDPFFGYGTSYFTFVVEGTALGGSGTISTSNMVGQLAPSGPYTASFTAVTTTMPFMSGFQGGVLTVAAVPGDLPAARATTSFRTPIKNLPIVFVAGTSGFSLDTAFYFPQGYPGGIKAFPWICKNCPLGYAVFPPGVFNYGTGIDPAGLRVWLGSEFVSYVVAEAATSLLAGLPYYNGANNYLDALRFDASGANTVFPQIGAGTLISTVNLAPFSTAGAAEVYGPLLSFLQNDMGRPLNSGPNGVYLFPYDFRQDMSTQVISLTAFVDSVISTTGAPRVNLLSHSLGGPISRAYYLTSAANAAKVDQLISLSGGFGGVGLTSKILVMGDNWGKGWAPSLGAGNFGPTSIGFAEWKVEELAQNWGTAYFQGPNSEGYFLDDVSNGGVFDRRYLVDDRWFAQPISPTYAAHTNFITRTYNAAIATRADTFFRSLSPGLDDFTNGTNGVYHHRVFTHKILTDRGGRLFTAPSARCFSLEPLDAVTRALECIPVTWRAPLHGDGDVTITYHGLLGRTLPQDDRVYVRDGPKHAEIVQITQTHQLVSALLNGFVCRAQQVQSSLGYQPHTVNTESTQFGTPLPAGAANPNAEPARGATADADAWHLEVRGPAMLEVTDQLGRRLGPSKTMAGLFDTQIPNAIYNPGLEYADAYVEGAGTYTFALGGLSPAGVHLFLTGYAAGAPLETRTFVAIPLTGTSRATMTLSTGGIVTPELRLDYLGNGQIQVIAPAATLTPQAAQDHKPPTTTIGIADSIVTLLAADDPGGSGVLRTYYSINWGAFQVYTQPFALPPGTRTLTAFSIDRNANVEAPFQTRTLTLDLFLPLISR